VLLSHRSSASLLSKPFQHLLIQIVAIHSNCQPVPFDAAIAIAFGLIGAILSLVGVLVACLTLRFMMIEKCWQLYSFLSLSSHTPSKQCRCSRNSLIDERNQRIYGDREVFRHEHTHLFSLSPDQGLRQRQLRLE
jgi:hypothetical protein